MQYQPFKIRCSAISEIMADVKGGRLIPVGAETMAERWITSQMYGRSPLEVYSKYTEKGKEKESEAISFYADFLGTWFVKNEKRFDNDFLSGCPDILDGKVVRDIKCSWDCFTFPLFKELPKNYWWQMQGYMALTGCESAVVAFILMDATEQQIESAAYSYAKSIGSDLTEDIESLVRENMTYSNLPAQMRIKEFVVQPDKEAIERVRLRVEAMREYIATLV